MRLKWKVPSVAALAWLGLLVQAGAQQLPTVDEAIEISRKTGRPIFAMAGNKT